jgi:nicotinamidase/pyrazinamidase
MPGGGLAVEGGDRILPTVKTLMESGIFDRIVATQDWHPAGHISFASSHQGRKPREAVDLYGHSQTL